MGGRPPCRASLPQAWVGLPEAPRSGLPSLLCPIRAGSVTNTNTGCAWLACRLFPARPEENRGKLLSKLHGPSKTMGDTKSSHEPGRVRASQTGVFVPGREREQCPCARLEAGFRPVPQFGPLDPLGGGRRPVALGGKRGENPRACAGLRCTASCCRRSVLTPLGECGRKGSQECLQAWRGRRPPPSLGVSFPHPSSRRADGSTTL